MLLLLWTVVLFLTLPVQQPHAQCNESTSSTMRVVLSSFDDTIGGATPQGQWYSRVFSGAGSIQFDYVKTPSVQGSGALRLTYTAVQTETWGGFVDLGHISANRYAIGGCSQISFWYNNALAASNPGRAHLRFILLDGSHCAGKCTLPPGEALEQYYSFHHVLDDSPGWRKVVLGLEGSDEVSAPFWRTGWLGITGNRILDPDSVQGFRFEISIDSNGDLGSKSSGVLLLDGLECSGRGVLNAAFDYTSWEHALKAGSWWSRENGIGSNQSVAWDFPVSASSSQQFGATFSIGQAATANASIFQAGYDLPSLAYYNLSHAESVSIRVQALGPAQVHAYLVLRVLTPCHGACRAEEDYNSTFTLRNYYSPPAVLNVTGEWREAKLHLLDDLGDEPIDRSAIKGFSIELHVNASDDPRAVVPDGSVVFDGFCASGNVSSEEVQDSVDDLAYERDVIFLLWQEPSAIRHSFIATPRECGESCLRHEGCLFFSHHMPAGHGNCATAKSLSHSNARMKVRREDAAYTSGWLPSRRPRACGAAGVCDCSTDGLVACRNQSLRIAPLLSFDLRLTVKELSFIGTGVSVLTAQLLGEMPSLRLLNLGSSVGYMEKDVLSLTPALTDLRSEISLGGMILNKNAHAFSHICCYPGEQVQVGTAVLWTCWLDDWSLGIDCEYEPFWFYSEEVEGEPVLDRITESNPRFGWAASTAPSCCDLCEMIRGCTHWVLDSRVSNSENLCIIRNSASGKIYEREDRYDYSCPYPRSSGLCESLPLEKMGPGYVSGYTPRQRAAYQNVSLHVSTKRIVLGHSNNYSMTYEIMLGGPILRGAVWVVPQPQESALRGQMHVYPSQLVFHRGEELKQRQVTVHFTEPPNIEQLECLVQHEVTGCDAAWGFLSAQPSHAIWISVLPLRCESGMRREDGSCEPCLAGTYLDDIFNRCMPCPAGTSSGDDARECQLCSPGRFSTAGHHHRNSSKGVCVPCWPGRYAASMGSDICELCDLGLYASQEGQTSCTECDPSGAGNATTLYKGALAEEDCVCPTGSHFDGEQCRMCPNFVGLECAGGHPITSSRSLDMTVNIKEGYMTLQEDPLDVFFCVERDFRCPGPRAAYDQQTGMCAHGFDSDSPQCAVCRQGRYKAPDGSCETCDDSNGFVAVAQFLGAVLVEFLLIVWMYMRWNRSNPAGIITVAAFITFLQLLQKLGRLPLRFPGLIRPLFQALDGFLTVPGWMIIIQFKYECAFGSNFTLALARDLIVPLTPVLHFGVMQIIWLLCLHRSLNFNYVVNVMGMIFKGWLVTISGMTLQLFIQEEMPNGKRMVKEFPQLVFASSSWFSALPLAIGAFVIYVVPLLTTVAFAVWVAPHKAGSSPGFMDRYRFAFGPLRPDRWWWVMVQLSYALGMTLVQTLSDSVYVQIYLSILVVLAVMVFEAQVQPYRFRQNNVVEMMLKLALLTFLILASSFIRFDSLTAEDRTRNENRSALIIVLVLGLAFLFTSFSFCTWVKEIVKPPGYVIGAKARLAFEFRDVVVLLGLMSNKEFLKHIVHLSDHDLRRLKDCMRTIVALFLQLQPSSKWRRQRLLPGVPYRERDTHTQMVRALMSVINGAAQSMAEENAKSRLALLKLAEDMRGGIQQEQGGATDLSYPLAAWQYIVGNTGTFRHKKPDRWHVFGTGTSKVSEETFVKRVAPIAHHLDSHELRGVFDLLDLESQGRVSVGDFLSTMRACAPRLVHMDLQRQCSDMLTDLHKTHRHRKHTSVVESPPNSGTLQFLPVSGTLQLPGRSESLTSGTLQLPTSSGSLSSGTLQLQASGKLTSGTLSSSTPTTGTLNLDDCNGVLCSEVTCLNAEADCSIPKERSDAARSATDPDFVIGI